MLNYFLVKFLWFNELLWDWRLSVSRDFLTPLQLQIQRQPRCFFLGFKILRWSDRFRERNKKVQLTHTHTHTELLFSGADNLSMLFGNENPITEVIIWWGFSNWQDFSFLLFLNLMITLNRFAPHGMDRDAQFCSPLIWAFEAQCSEAAAKQAPYQAGSKIRQFGQP